MTAVHILICLTKGKSREEIARDFDDNLELVRVWIDYMIAINWVYKNWVYKNEPTALGWFQIMEKCG